MKPRDSSQRWLCLGDGDARGVVMTWIQQETVASREILDLDLEVHQRFEECGGGTGGEINDPPAARVPPA